MADFGLRIADCACLTASAGRDCGLRDVRIWDLGFGILNCGLKVWTLKAKPKPPEVITLSWLTHQR